MGTSTKEPSGGKSSDAGETAESFSAQYEKDFAAAQRKYNGKTVELAGPAFAWQRSPFGNDPRCTLILQGVANGDLEGFAKAYCRFAEAKFDADPRLRALSRGQRVTLRGREQGLRDPSLADCEVISVAPSTAIPTTLAKLASETVPKKDLGRFKGRDVLVRAEVREVSVGASVEVNVARPEGVGAGFKFSSVPVTAAYAKELEAVKAGDTVLILAEPHKVDASGIEFRHARTLKSVPAGLTLPDGKE